MRDSSARPALSAATLTAMVFVVGVAATLVLATWVADHRQDDNRAEFTERSDKALDSMESVVDSYIDDFDHVVTFAGALDPPSPAQFERFVGSSEVVGPLDGGLALYVERVAPEDLDRVVRRETRLRGRAFNPLTLRTGETLYLVMRSAQPGSGLDLPPGDVAMIASLATLFERTEASRQFALVDVRKLLDEMQGPTGLAETYGLTTEQVMGILDNVGISQLAAQTSGEYGVLAPVADDEGDITGFILGDAIPAEPLERLATRELSVSVSVADGEGARFAVAGPAVPVDESTLIDSRTVTVGGLTFELLAYPAAGGSDAALSELLVLTGLAATVLVALLVHVWRRWDLHADVMAAQLETTERRANTDPLTDLLNRVGITEALSELLDQRDVVGGLVAVLFIDVDRLKVVNDSLGHGVGDKVLNSLAVRFGQVAEPGAVVGRFGGDEFVLVAGGLRDLGAAVAFAQDVLRSLDRPLAAGEVELRMDASIGVSFARQNEEVSASDLIRDADAAMYESKRTGGGSYSVFDDRLRVEAVDRLLVEQSLGQAVQLDEMETWFQPIVDAVDSTVVALEALVRWRSDGDGVVLPHRFLPVALETGLIVPIGDVVLSQACDVAAEIADDGIDMAVNLSERELADPRCLERVMAAVDESGLDPSRLTLEISEDLMIDRLARSVELLRTIHGRGVRLSIDDFGTGRSSLSYVKRLDMIAELKIDQSFVAEIASSEADRAIVAAIMAMTTSLGMEVVAEGVETEAQLNTLRDLGVRQMQGYYFGRPQPRQMVVAMTTTPLDEPA